MECHGQTAGEVGKEESCATSRASPGSKEPEGNCRPICRRFAKSGIATEATPDRSGDFRYQPLLYAFTVANCQFLLQPISGKNKTPLALQSVIPAVAMANVAKKLGRYDLMEQAHRHYGQALKKMAKGLTNPEVAKHDATLLTALMLGLYEVRSVSIARR
jgi:hypothetical protein